MEFKGTNSKTVGFESLPCEPDPGRLVPSASKVTRARNMGKFLENVKGPWEGS